VCADDVRAFCDAVGIERPIVLGHSLGGFVAAAYGVRHPGHPGALVLQSTWARFDLERIVETFRRIGGDEMADIAERAYGEDGEVTDEEWERCWRLFGPWVTGETERARTVSNAALNPRGMELMRAFDVVGELGRVACPTLVCTGELDPITPPAAAREIVDALPPEHARLELLADAGHFPWQDVPDTYWSLLTGFVTAA
jgi:proline iminopeptidase